MRPWPCLQRGWRELNGRLDELLGTGPLGRLATQSATRLAVLPTGWLGLDLALACSGLTRSRLHLLYGPAGVGKTTLALQFADQLLATGHTVAYVDGALDPLPEALAARGRLTHLAGLVTAYPRDPGEFFALTMELVASRGFDLILLDGLQTLEREPEQAETREEPVLLEVSRRTGFRKELLGLRQRVASTETALLALARPGHGPGLADRLETLAAIRLRLSRTGRAKAGRDPLAATIRLTVEGGRRERPAVGVPHLLPDGEGLFDAATDVLRTAIALGVLREEAGGWRWGREPADQAGAPVEGSALRNPELLGRLRRTILERWGGPPELLTHYLRAGLCPARSETDVLAVDRENELVSSPVRLQAQEDC